MQLCLSLPLRTILVQRFSYSLQQPQKRKALSMPYLEGLLHCVIQIEHGLRCTLHALRVQTAVSTVTTAFIVGNIVV